MPRLIATTFTTTARRGVTLLPMQLRQEEPTNHLLAEAGLAIFVIDAVPEDSEPAARAKKLECKLVYQTDDGRQCVYTSQALTPAPMTPYAVSETKTIHNLSIYILLYTTMQT